MRSGAPVPKFLVWKEVRLEIARQTISSSNPLLHRCNHMCNHVEWQNQFEPIVQESHRSEALIPTCGSRVFGIDRQRHATNLRSDRQGTASSSQQEIAAKALPPWTD